MQKNKYIVLAQSGLLAVIGLGLVIQSIFRFIDQHVHFAHLQPIDPFGVSSGIILTITGLTLIYLIPYLYQRRKVAYIVTLALTATAFFAMILEHRKALLLHLILVAFMGWMLLSHRLYRVKSDLVSLRVGIRIALLVAGLGFAYGCIGILLLGPAAFHQHFTFIEAATLSFQVLFTLRDVTPPTIQAEFLINSLNIIGGLVFVLMVTSLFRPVRFVLVSHNNDRVRVKKILTESSISSEDYFKLWPNDKHYYFSPSHNSFLAYKTAGRTAIVLGDPSGKKNEFKQLVTEFFDFVSSNGWRVAIINATPLSESVYKNIGLNKLFIGNEAVVDIHDFTTHTLRSKHFRHAYNKAKSEGLTTEYWHDISDEQMNSLKRVSDAWLSRRGRKEYTFFMGYFDATYLRSGTVMVLKQHDKVIAYINCIPTFLDQEVSIDHLRFMPGAPSVSMHFLLAQLIKHLSAAGKTSLNIGLAPLSGIENQPDQSRAAGNILKIIKKVANRLYSFKGVEQFKGKSSPVWHPRYLYYMGTLASLTTLAGDLDRASRFIIQERPRVIGLIALYVLALILIQFL
jgi:phosphatidylglycerol lysyltransferase